jgi:hypothetical protein
VGKAPCTPAVRVSDDRGAGVLQRQLVAHFSCLCERRCAVRAHAFPHSTRSVTCVHIMRTRHLTLPLTTDHCIDSQWPLHSATACGQWPLHSATACGQWPLHSATACGQWPLHSATACGQWPLCGRVKLVTRDAAHARHGVLCVGLCQWCDVAIN